jgi:hypothetical protein
MVIAMYAGYFGGQFLYGLQGFSDIIVVVINDEIG